MILFLIVEINVKELNGAKLDKNNFICIKEFKNVKDLVLTQSKIEEPNLLDVKNFKVQNLAFLMKDLKYKLSLEGWTYVLGVKHNYVFVNHTSKAKSFYNNQNFEYFSRYLIVKLVKDKNLCLYEIELK